MTAEEILTELQASFPGLAKSDAQVKDYPAWTVPAQSVRAVCERLRSKFSFDYLDVITAVDWSGQVNPKGYPQSLGQQGSEAAGQPDSQTAQPSSLIPHPSSFPQGRPAAQPAGARDIFELVYLVSALSTGVKICLRCEIPRKEPAAPSLYGIFMAADWQEREVYDLFGIHFEGHPNLKRILTPETQAGYPLRKDYEHVSDRYD
ncbi:MAG: NADH-quinone oxidoreductase subunit C [Elusimicrobia bacterium]|nr:NADH-quinone oxidoreductase subunit C [Elusimicrobiota bacterium]